MNGIHRVMECTARKAGKLQGRWRSKAPLHSKAEDAGEEAEKQRSDGVIKLMEWHQLHVGGSNRSCETSNPSICIPALVDIDAFMRIHGVDSTQKTTSAHQHVHHEGAPGTPCAGLFLRRIKTINLCLKRVHLTLHAFTQSGAPAVHIVLHIVHISMCIKRVHLELLAQVGEFAVQRCEGQVVGLLRRRLAGGLDLE